MSGNESISNGMRATYQRKMLEIRGAFEAGGATGAETIAGRTAAVDELVRGLWREAVERDPRLTTVTAVVAVGGYGRRELFPYSDVDLLFLLDGKTAEVVFSLIQRLHVEHQLTSVLVTHSMEFAGRCGRVLRLRDGRLEGQILGAESAKS